MCPLTFNSVCCVHGLNLYIEFRDSMTDTFTAAGQLAGHLPGLLLEAERVAHAFMKGSHGRRRVGQGESFWQFRPWTDGDQSRDVDWKQSGKRDGVFVRQREWEAAQTLWLWRDQSASMDFSSDKNTPTKKDCAEILLLALSMLALDGGERVGLLGTDLAPLAHHGAASRLAEFLPRQTRLAEAARPVAARSQVVLFSDFFFDLKDIESFCIRLAQREVPGLLIQLTDPAERTLPFDGRVRFLDVENKGASFTAEQVESLRAVYEERFLAHRAALADMARANGWKFLNFSTNVSRETILTALYEELAVRR
jgi:uncharacterized protein (DUF58 family)